MINERMNRTKVTKALQILSFLLLGPLLARAQMSFPGDKEREGICKELVRRSSLVVVAIPASQPDEIVDRAKFKAALAPGRVPDVAQLNGQVVGRLFNAKVVDVLKGEGSVKNGELVKLFVSGGDVVSFDALNVVEPGKEAIFFLSRMSESDARLKDAGVLPPQAKTMELLPFDVSGLYKFTDEKSWSMMSSSAKTLKIIKRAVHAHSNPQP
ncbi:MAG: hypothetical protein DMG50_07045 [Acidobacteria bacterium]|nr:MAG: hypothetical protein DMG50_07045 [Acidobacteriota bacterium]